MIEKKNPQYWEMNNFNKSHKAILILDLSLLINKIESYFSDSRQKKKQPELDAMITVFSLKFENKSEWVKLNQNE